MKNPKKNPNKHGCIPCDYYTSHKNDFIRHIYTDKHQRNLLETFGNILNPLLTPLHICSKCNKEYKSKSGLWKHYKLCKENVKMGDVPVNGAEQLLTPLHICSICNKGYKSKSGLWKHSKLCKEGVLKMGDVSMNGINSNGLLALLIQQQEELNSKNSEILELHKLKNTVNNTNNISINIFLNEHCKDAMNLTDFVESLKLSLEDLNYTGKYGYTKGIANILIKSLGEIDPTERPIHCTDKKRMQFYIKDEDKWEKDESNKKIDKSIAAVTAKQYTYIKEWEKRNKGYETSGEKIDDFFKLTSNCNPYEDNCNVKVMKRVADTIQIKEAMSTI